MSSGKSDRRSAIEPILVFAGSALSAFAGYCAAVEVFQDGEKAVVGFLWGAAAFALTTWMLAFVFKRAYRARGGSPWLVAIVAGLLPALMLCFAGFSNFR